MKLNLTRIFFSVSLIILISAFARSEEIQSAQKKLEELNIPFNSDAFISHASQGDDEITELFLSAGLNPDVKNSHGIGALTGAILYKSPRVVKFLLDHG